MSKVYEGRIGDIYSLITGDEDARVCKDIPESACYEQPRNFFAYLLANLFNKIADELSSAKLILPWLMSALGVPLAFVGFLVPIRETGVLLPQLFVAAAVRHMPQRKPVWLLGGLLSMLSLSGMLLVALIYEGIAAGYILIALLVVFSLSRGLCSVSAKDVLGKTVSKSRRGVLMGYSAGISGLFVLLTGVLLSVLDTDNAPITILILLLGVAVIMWVLSLASFHAIIEEPGATEGGGNAIEIALQGLASLKTDDQFRHFVIVRVLLLSIALAPPFYVLLAQQSLNQDISALGILIIASGLAGSVSSPFWGRWGDHSSRHVMMASAAGAALLGMLTSAAVWLEMSVLDHIATHAVVFMLLIMMHSGARLGRKVYLVDMATAENRAMYVAVSNTVIGVVMLLMGGIGILTGVVGLAGVILLLAVLSLVAMAAIYRLDAV